MLLKYLYEDYVGSVPFISEQLRFEMKVYEQVVKECGDEESVRPDRISQCIAKHENKLKSYALFVQLIAQKRGEELKKKTKETCQKINEQEALIKCIRTQSQIQINSTLEQDKEYIKLMRQEILSMK